MATNKSAGTVPGWLWWFLDFRYFVSVVYRLVRRPRSLALELDIWKDFLGFRQTARGVINSMPQGGQTRGDVLIVSLSGMIYSVKVEGILAKALQLRGYTPVILTSRYSFWTRHYFRSFGITRFLFTEDYQASDAEREIARRHCETMLKGTVDLPNCKAWTFEGASVGQYAVSTVARQLHRGMPDFEDPEVRRLLAEKLQLCIERIFSARHIFSAISPDICLFHEINYTDYGPVYSVAFNKGLNVIQFVSALKDNALIFKRSVPETYRIHPNSISRTEMEKLGRLPWSDWHDAALQKEFRDRYGGMSFVVRRDQKGKQQKDRQAIIEQLGLDPDKKIAVVFSHVLWDANLFYGDDLFDDNEHWFIETLKAACRNDRVNWIIRLHPAISWKREWERDNSELNELSAIRKHIGELPTHVKLLMPDNDINSISIFKISDYGVTIRGTVGIELPCYGVPVLTAGTGRYSGLGFTLDSGTRDEYLGRLLEIDRLPPLTVSQVELAKKHAYAIFCLRPWVMTSFVNSYDESIRGFYPLNPNVRIKVRSEAELLRSDDLRKFAEWAETTSKYDYLEAWGEAGSKPDKDNRAARAG